MIYGLSILFGNAFTAIYFVHSRLFDIYKFDIPLNKMQLLQFKNKRIYSVVFFENIPQILLQIGYILSLSSKKKINSIVYATMCFSILSLLITLLSINLYKKIIESRDYTHIEIDIKGQMIINNMNKCKNRINKLRQQLSGILGVSPKSIDIQRPFQIPNGLRISMNVYINNIKSIDINCSKILSNSIKSGQLNKIFQQCWQLSSIPNITNLNHTKHESKEREKNTVIIKHETEMIKKIKINKINIPTNHTLVASDSTLEPGDDNNTDINSASLPPMIPPVVVTPMILSINDNYPNGKNNVDPKDNDNNNLVDVKDDDNENENDESDHEDMYDNKHNINENYKRATIGSLNMMMMMPPGSMRNSVYSYNNNNQDQRGGINIDVNLNGNNNDDEEDMYEEYNDYQQNYKRSTIGSMNMMTIC